MACSLALSLLLVAALAGGQPLTGGDSAYVETIKNIITDANNFLEDHQLDEMSLPNIGGYLPTDVVKLTDGKLGKLNSLEISGTPTVTNKTTTDGSSMITFDVPLSFGELVWSYQYHVKLLFGLWSREGSLTLTPESNSWRVQGYATLKKDGTCFAHANSVTLENSGKLKLFLTPDDIPELTTISEALLNFGTSNLKPTTNLAFAALLLQSGTQEKFNDFVCKRISVKV